jgi:hypothetical protein
MLIFGSLGARDDYKIAKDGEKCVVGNNKYIFNSGTWHSLVDVVSLERDSVVCSNGDCTCGHR